MKVISRLLLLELILALDGGTATVQADCAPMPGGAVAWWRAENNALDSVDSHQGVLQNGATFAAGQAGQAFSFDGLNSFVNVPDSTDWHFGMADFTIELWTKLNQIQKSMLIHQQSGTNTGGFEFDVQPDVGQLIFARDPNHAAIGRAWSPAPNTWYHLAVTRTQGAYRLFVNGQQLGAEEPDPNPVANVSGPLRIGNWAAPNYPLNGLIDELTIYSRALSPAEIQAIFNAGSAGKCFFAVDWFKVAGGGGTSSDATRSLSGTIGQADAGGPLTNAQFSLVGGFWALPIAVQVTGAPTLRIVAAGSGLATISWSPATPGFHLQFSDSVTSPNWSNAPSGSTNPVTVPATFPKKFYRLIQP